MSQSDKNSPEARRERIAEALHTFATTPKQKKALPDIHAAMALWHALEPGREFVSTCAIRVMPKVSPKPGVQMKAAIMQSRVFVAGTRFRVVARAASTPAKWWRVEVMTTDGAVMYRGFVLNQAIRGTLAA